MPTVYMPLVRTEMIAPTSIYKAFPTLSPNEAAASSSLRLIVIAPPRVGAR